MSGDLAGLLAALARSTPSLPGALCRDTPNLFDPHDRENEPPEDWLYRRGAAVRTCQACPELAACGAWLDSLPLPARPTGIVAGRLARRPAWRPKVAI